MRIIAGLAKGRRISAPPGDDVRPTGDRVREALFSSLQPLLPGAHVLDLYAGSGALGLEAASRGAARVTLVERDRRTLEVLRANVEVVALPGVEVVAGDVASLLADARLPAAPFDLVLADPPYRLPGPEVDAMLRALLAQLSEGGVVVLERCSRDAAPDWPHGYASAPTRRYGSTVLHRAHRVAGPG